MNGYIAMIPGDGWEYLRALAAKEDSVKPARPEGFEAVPIIGWRMGNGGHLEPVPVDSLDAIEETNKWALRKIGSDRVYEVQGGIFKDAEEWLRNEQMEYDLNHGGYEPPQDIEPEDRVRP